MIDIKNKISSFFIFNSTFGPKEGDELKRILFYYPNEVTFNARKTQVGLCEAVVKFMTTFSSEPCEALQTQTKKYIFYEPEKDFWMVLVVQMPYAAKALAAVGDQKEIIEPSIMSDYLKTSYKMFRMFVSRFGEIPIENVYNKSEQFFAQYITSSHITNEITNIIQGISYLPLQKNSFFNVVCFIDLLEVTYQDFKCVSFIYNDQLIWNGLATNDMLTLYQYLVKTLLPKQIEKEIQGGAVTAAERHGRFICPNGIRNAEDLQSLKRVYLTREDDTEPKPYFLIIYRTLSATVCFTVNVDINLEIDTFRSLDAFIGQQLYSIASSISEECAMYALQNAQNSNSDNKFVYFNRLNLAFKTFTTPLNPSAAIKPEVLSIISEMHFDRKSLGNYGEIVMKTPDEYWITGKCSNEREFYVIIYKKNANLKEIADEVKRVCQAQLKGVFFYPI